MTKQGKQGKQDGGTPATVLLGGSKAAMAEVATSERATGYVAGGISPIGQKRPHRIVLDTSALDHPTILVSAGRRGLDLEIRPADLVAITGAITSQVRAQPGRRSRPGVGRG